MVFLNFAETAQAGTIQADASDIDISKAEGLKAEKTAAKKVTLKWKKVKGADDYLLMRKKPGNKEYKIICKTRSTSFTDSQAKGRREYFYKVCALKKAQRKDQVGQQIMENEAEGRQIMENEAEGQLLAETKAQPASKACLTGPAVTTLSAVSIAKEINSYRRAKGVDEIDISTLDIPYYYKGKNSSRVRVYVQPEHPKMVFIGECYVEGMSQFKGAFPRGTKIYGMSGMNTATAFSKNDFNVGGKTVSAIEAGGYLRPDRVYFILGINESISGNTHAYISAIMKYKKMYEKINPHVQIVNAALPPVGRTSALNIPSLSQRKAFNDAIKAKAKKTDRYYYCDSTEKVLNDGSGYLKSSCDGGDGCHWNSSATLSVIKEIEKWSMKNLGSYR
ncbi:MAG: SGNH/GDSL hydrolase family protein [Lachnospiraceae bacterium]|nr:SGNH/GDSL hydrolase family protein [Lachnospiraceae bacterium]